MTDLPARGESGRYAVDTYGPLVDCRTLSYTGQIGHEVQFYARGDDRTLYRAALTYTADVSGAVVEDRDRILGRENENENENASGTTAAGR